MTTHRRIPAPPAADPPRERLAARQAELAAAMVGTGPVPAGFDRRAVETAARSLLRKRAGAVRTSWPLLAAGCGDRWTELFAGWAAGRPSAGSLRDGWDLARELAAGGELPPIAAAELAGREARWRYDGGSAPRRRWLPHRYRSGATVAFQALGRVWSTSASGTPAR